MNKQLIAQALLVKAKARAKANYYEYVKYTHDPFEELAHIKLICSEIDAMINKRKAMLLGDEPIENQYLILSIPPRHGKSMTVTETLPSYFMNVFEKSKAIMTAYSITLADDFARSNAKKMDEFRVFDTTVESNNQDRMTLSNGSVCVKAGIMGGITGKGANLLIIDDPIKTQEEASSQTTRDKIWREWQSSLSTRLEEAAIVILIMTRWHEDDIAGRLLNPEYGKPLPWKVINLPLEAEEDDILGREPGEPLWNRYGKDFIEERKQYPQTFNALYQGRPTSEEGNIIKKEWFETDSAWYDLNDDMLKKMNIMCMSVDATFKDTKKSDKVAIGVWGKIGKDFYIIEELNKRMDFLATLQAIKNLKRTYPKVGMIFIEDKANGSAIINVLNKELSGIVPVNPLGGKESRLQSVLPYLVNSVKLPRNRLFTKPMLEEWYAFPNGAHDDSVDEMTQAISRMMYYFAGDKKEHKQTDYDRYQEEMLDWS